MLLGDPRTPGQFRPCCRVRIEVTHRNKPQIGDRLIEYRRAWVEGNCSSSVLSIITSGYILPFCLRSRLTIHPLIISGYKDQHEDLALASCSHFPEQAGHGNTKSLRYYSCLLLVPKPQQNGDQSYDKSIPDVRIVQNRSPRLNKDISKFNVMDVVNRPPGSLSAYPNSLNI